MKEFNKQVDKDHYNFLKYIDDRRWMSFYYQIIEILDAKPNEVLDIGVGPGIIGIILKNIGIDYYSMDIDPELKPDYIGTVTDIKFQDNKFDVISCCQVLEHIPFEQFEFALKEIFRVTKCRVIISLPDARPKWRYVITIPKVGTKKILLNRPFFRKKEHIFEGEHYWEINKKKYELNKIVKIIEKTALLYDFTDVKTYRVVENPSHRFFIIKK